MNNFISATASTFFVGMLALIAGRMSSPEPTIESPFGSAAVASANSPNQNQVMSEMLDTLSKIKQRLETSPDNAAFDSGGSDGATNSPTWPTPVSPSRVTPGTSGSGSTGNRLYSTQPVVTYYGSTGSGVSTSAYGSTGGYATPANYSRFSNGSRLVDRIRARTAQPARRFGSNVICVDGVCY